jgi:hypothetical protein
MCERSSALSSTTDALVVLKLLLEHVKYGARVPDVPDRHL